MSKEQVNHPEHYGEGVYEVINIIEHFPHIDNSMHLGNVVKYVLRAGKKGDALEDLKKAQFYLSRKIKRMEDEKSN